MIKVTDDKGRVYMARTHNLEAVAHKRFGLLTVEVRNGRVRFGVDTDPSSENIYSDMASTSSSGNAEGLARQRAVELARFLSVEMDITVEELFA